LGNVTENRLAEHAARWASGPSATSSKSGAYGRQGDRRAWRCARKEAVAYERMGGYIDYQPEAQRTKMIDLIEERMAEIKIFLMFGPFPEPWTCLSDRLSRELVILKSLARRAPH
jgi:hypothetical protein